MVLETVAMARPRRQAALNGVKAVGRVNESRADQPKSGSLAKKPVRAKARPSVTAVADSGSELTESSDEEEDEDGDTSAASVSESDDGDEDDDEDAFTPVKGKGNKGRRSMASVKRTREPAKKTSARIPSTSKTRAKANGAKAAASKSATPKAKRGQATGAVGASRPGRRGGNKDELPINSDNVLFNAVTSSDSDLRAVAEDWMVYYQDNYVAAMAQFMNFVFRACGSNDSIDETQVDDIDHIVEVLEEIQNTFKKANLPSYPLVSRAPMYRKFRRSLSGLVEHIFTAASEADLLHDERMVDTMVAWVGAMSSSTFRAFRHTATTVILLMMGQIARLNQDARKQFEQLSKLRDAEKGRKDANATRVRQLNDQVRQVNAKRQMLDRVHKDLDETVFIHRYRDSDPTIRADCMEELGRWMRICPAQFLNNNYLRYFAWELSDESAIVRLVVVQALKMLFARQETDALPQALETFSQRSLDRMVEIATGDVDTSVRTAMVNTLVHMDRLGLIDEDEDGDEEASGKVHAALTKHIFDSDPKVRLAVAQFVANLAERNAPEAEEFDDNRAHKKAQLKALAALLARVDADLNGDQTQTQVVAPLSGSLTHSRISLAVRALLETTDLLQDWKPLLDILIVDHSGDRAGAPRKKGAKNAAAPDAPRLEPAEEAVLIECLVVLMQKAGETLPREEDDGEDVASKMTKDLISALPKLLNKYKTEASRIGDVLQLIKHMRLAKYLEFQQMAAYEALWDQVVDQFQRHTESEVISHAVEAMKAMAATSALNNVNEIKLHGLRELTVTALKDDGPSFAQLTSTRSLAIDDVHALTACTSRLKHLIRLVDLSENFDESDDDRNDGGAWDVLLACAQRAPMGRPEEAAMVEDAIVSLALYVIWKTNALVGLDNDATTKATQAEFLLSKREALLSLCERIFEVSSDESSTSGAKRQAFGYLLDIHIMYANLAALDAERALSLGNDAGRKLPEVLHLTLSPSTQEILATFAVQEIRRFSTDSEEEGALSNASAVGEADDEATDKRVTLTFLQKQYSFVSLISHYIGAIRLGLVDIERSAPLLAYYGRMGALYDACLRVLVEGVREVGIHQQRPSVACRVLLNALVQAFELVRASPETELTFVNLAKMLSSCIVVRGAHLTVVQSIDTTALIRLHDRLIDWSLAQLRETEGPGTLALSMFKAMAQLLIGIQPREALTIKANMDRAVAAHQIEVTATGKSWEPLRSYEKRLVTIASKSDAITRKVAGKARKPAAAAGSDQQAADEDNEEYDDAAAPSSPTSARQAAHARPRARQRGPRSTPGSAAGAAVELGGFTLTQQDEDDVDSILGRRASQRAHAGSEEEMDDSAVFDGGDDDDDDGFGNTSAALSLPAFDLSQTTSAAEASQLFRGRFDDATKSQRPSRRARPSRSLYEEDDDEDESTQRSRSKRSRQK